jgi:hypothetical protein
MKKIVQKIFNNSLVHDFSTQTNKTEKGDIDMIISSEITHYFNSSIHPLNQNPFVALKILKISYPHLHSLATEYLQLVATSGPAEGVTDRELPCTSLLN